MEQDQGCPAMTGQGCTLCIGAMPEGEWCRDCGYGKSAPERTPESKSALLDAIDRARHPNPAAFTEAYNRGCARDE